jgi:hypothetical protein
MTIARLFGFGLACFTTALVLAGCGGADDTTSGSGTGAGGGSSGGSGSAGGGQVHSVTFRYTPAWTGVNTVSVIGGFGRSDDWAVPFLSLTGDGTGTFSATADLPAGQYLYVYEVRGDSAGRSNYLRYSLASDVSDYDVCPLQSPTYDPLTLERPCSRMSVPQPAPEPMYHLKGTVLYDGMPKEGYLVIAERAEMPYDEYFVNRMNSQADGSFDLLVPGGSYRLQVQHPTYLNTADPDRDPMALQAARRAFSSRQSISADTTIPPAELAYHDYAALAPTGTTTLPTTFQITVIAGAQRARAAVYGTHNDAGKLVTDPWYTSAYDVQTSVAFDGIFNTTSAPDPQVVPMEGYFWGTWQEYPEQGGVSWRVQSMVFPIMWTP